MVLIRSWSKPTCKPVDRKRYLLLPRSRSIVKSKQELVKYHHDYDVLKNIKKNLINLIF